MKSSPCSDQAPGHSPASTPAGPSGVESSAGLDPHAAAVLQALSANPRPDYSELPLQVVREAHERHAGALDAPPTAGIEVQALELSLPAGPRRARLYFPADLPAAGASPMACVLWYHGGGHVVGSLDLYDAICRDLAHRSGSAVLAVSYRLAPEHKFPCAVEDATAALEWLFDNAARRGIDPARIAVAGDSAGGNLAAVCALHARERVLPLRHQLLIYPATAPFPDMPSHQRFGQGHLLTLATILWFQEHYLRSEADRHDPRYAPLIARRHDGLAPATVVVASHDPIRDEGVAYAGRLRAARNDVELIEESGLPHAFLNLRGAIPAADRALSRLAGRLRQALTSQPA